MNLIQFSPQKREFNLIKMDLHNKERVKKKMKKRRSKWDVVCEKLSTIFHNFSGHRISSFDGFVNLMHREVDAASLGIGRMLFGEFLWAKNLRKTLQPFKTPRILLSRKRKQKSHKFCFAFLCRNNDAFGYSRRAKRRFGFAMGNAERLSLSTLSLHKTAFVSQNGTCLLSHVAR